MRIETDHRVYVFLFVLVSIIAAFSLKNDFLNVDDYALVVENPNIDVPLSKIPSLFTNPFGYLSSSDDSQAQFVYYRPVLTLVTVLDYKIWGLNPIGYHVIGLFMHLLSAVFVFKVGMILFNSDRIIALVAAALFAVHPAHNEALGRIVSNDIIVGLFIITSVYFFLRNKEKLSLLMFFLALLSKESAVMLPFVVCLIAVLKDGLKKGVMTTLPYVGLLGIYGIIRTLVIGSFISGEGAHFQGRLLTMAVALKDYARLLVIPYPLSPFYPARLYTNFSEPGVIISVAVLALLAYVGWKIRKDKSLLFSFLSIFIMLAPVIVKVNELSWVLESSFIAERQLYMPVMFYSLFLSGAILKNFIGARRNYAITGFAGAIVVFSITTALNIQIWEDDSTLSAKLIKVCPDIAYSHSHLGEAYYEQGKLDDAMQEFEAVFSSSSSYRKTVDRIESETGKDQGEVLYPDSNERRHTNFEVLRKYDRRYAAIYFNIGRVYFAKNDFDHAIRKFKVATILQDNIQARYYLGEAYLKSGQYSKARQEFHVALDEIRNAGLERLQREKKD
jgi:tetratricopeptide (TPR) repeat protein